MANTTKKLLSAAVAGSILAVSQTAVAQPTPIEVPANLSLAERAAWAGIEAAASLTAAYSAKTGNCNNSFSLSGDIYGVDPGEVMDVPPDQSRIGGVFTLDERDINIDVQLNHPQRGTQILVSADGQETIGGQVFRFLRGEYWFSRDSSIMYANMDFRIGPGSFEQAVRWGESIVKDFFVGPVAIKGEAPTVGIRDAGIEVIHKLDYPVTKWFQTSQYQRFNGVDGKFTIRKDRQRFFGGTTCVIRISGDLFDDFGGGLNLTNTTVNLSPL